jgi:hypothetical protein
MEATLKLKVSELDDSLFQNIKKLFEGKSVTITISSEDDETNYLLSNAGNEKFLMESMAEEPSVSFTIEEFKNQVIEFNK